MGSSLNNDLESAFRERNETLRGFYEAGATQLSEEEASSLTPILNELKNESERYKIIDKIAEGGEKVIHLVHDHRLERRVAMAHATRAKTAQDKERFLREARLTANLEHPNIMSIHNLGIDPKGEPFFTMALIKGDSLKDIIKKLHLGDEGYKRRYGLEDLLNIYLKICDAIAYAHSRNVLHLDIKPDNIKVGEFGEVFVCDWGLARVLNNSTNTSPTDEKLDGDILNDMLLPGTLKGTPGFMAPEQTIPYGERTPRTDVYALGSLLYNLLTLELPVNGKSANEVMDNTREGRIVHPRRRRIDRRLPTGLVAICMKALSLNPEDRYESVRRLRNDVNRYLAGKATSAENASVMTLFSLLIQRHSRMTFLLLFFFIALAGLIWLNLLVIAKEKTENKNALLQAERNFELYKNQQHVVKELGEDLDKAVLYTVKSRDFINAAAMIKVLERGMTESLEKIDRKNLLNQKGTLHFVLQHFNAAIVCFEMAGEDPTTAPILTLCHKYAQLKPQDNEQLSDQELAQLIQEPRSGIPNPTLYYMYYHHMNLTKVKNATEHLPLAIAILDKLNKGHLGDKNLTLTATDDGYHLDLSTSNYNTYTLNIIGVYRCNILAALGLNSLDISHTPIQDLGELRGMNLKELRMTGVKNLFTQQKVVKQFKQLNLKKLIISENTCPPYILKILKEQCDVEVVHPETDQP